MKYTYVNTLLHISSGIISTPSMQDELYVNMQHNDSYM